MRIMVLRTRLSPANIVTNWRNNLLPKVDNSMRGELVLATDQQLFTNADKRFNIATTYS